MKKVAHKQLIRIFATLALWLGWLGAPLSLQAQNNPYKIDDACYRYMNKVQRKFGKQEAVAMCDTFRILATQKKDQKAQCIAYNLIARAYNALNDEPHLRQAIENSRQCLRTPYVQYYYTTHQLLIQKLTMEDRIDEAMDEVERLQKVALEQNEEFGLGVAYQMKARVYFQTFDREHAIENFTKALKHIRASRYPSNAYVVEQSMGATYDIEADYEKADSMYQEALNHSPKSLHNTILLQKAICELKRGGYSLAHTDSVYAELEKAFKGQNIRGTTLMNYNQYRVRYALEHEKWDEARAYINKMPRGLSQYSLLHVLYHKKGDIDSAYYYIKWVSIEQRAQWAADNSTRLAQMENNTHTARLAHENQQLLIKHLEDQRRMLKVQQNQNLLKLRNSDLELQNKDNLLFSKQREADLQRTRAEKQQQEVLLQQERIRLMEHEKESTRRMNLSLYTLALVIIFFSIAGLLWMRNSKTKLRKEKEIAEEAQKRAENADKLKSLFLQNMSHEIRTPLNAIVGFNEVLNGGAGDDLSTEEKQEFTSLISTNATLLTTLVNDILDLSKLESGTYHIALSEVSATELCTNALSSVKGREAEGVTLQMDDPDAADRNLTFCTDAVRVQQVLINYLTNACKNTPSGSITLAYHTELRADNEPWIHFTVTDTGCGVPANKVKSIFNRFEKLDNFKQGTGLGLNICTRIAELLHGQVYLDTTYTHGARFALDLPLTTTIKESHT